MTPLELDEYLDHNDVEINDETLSIAHHGILGMKWGHLSGPPYPLGKGDHSANEKKAASKAGIKVGSDSGKGSIENIKKSGTTVSRSRASSKSETIGSAKKESRPETPEEHEAKRQAAIKSGSRVQVKKYAKEMSQDELREAMNRIDTMDELKKEPDGNGGTRYILKNLSPKEREKKEALESGDLRRIQSVATLATRDELRTALNKADLMASMNSELQEPAAMKKIDKAVKTAKQINDWARTGADVWNTIAGYSNTFAGTDLQKINYSAVGGGNQKKPGGQPNK